MVERQKGINGFSFCGFASSEPSTETCLKVEFDGKEAFAKSCSIDTFASFTDTCLDGPEIGT